MGYTEDKRFQIGWLSVVLMLGIAILVGYSGAVALSFAIGKKEPLITGSGALFAIIGAVLMLIYAGAELLLVIGGALAGIALAAIVYVVAKK